MVLHLDPHPGVAARAVEYLVPEAAEVVAQDQGEEESEANDSDDDEMESKKRWGSGGKASTDELHRFCVSADGLPEALLQNISRSRVAQRGMPEVVVGV